MEVVTTTPNGDGGARAQALAPPSLLRVYVTLVCCLGAASIVVALLGTSWTTTDTQIGVWPVAFLAVAALVGEAKPLRITRGDQPAETISASSPFILALLAVGGIGIALVVQAAASLVDDLLNRRELTKSAFNTAQYALSLVAARTVFCLLLGVPFFEGPRVVDVHDLGPLLVAGLVMLVVNRLLVAIVVSIAMTQPLREVLRDDLGFHLATQTVLLCIGGVAADVSDEGVAVLALLGAPVVAVYLTTQAALRHAYQASHDSLTGVGNRDRLYRQLDQAFSVAHRATSRGPGLVLLDLDHFKDINDTLGHPVGDQLLQQVAGRLVAALGDDARVNRLGGDEFAVMVGGDLRASQDLATTLLTSLEAPIKIGDLQLLVRASAGIAVAPDHGTDTQTLMKNADIALYQAKLERDRAVTYAAQFDINTVERLQLLADLRAAMDSRQLSVVYQPQVDLNDGSVVGVEALIRWQHPTRGSVPPDSFIPLAENSGLIAELTSYVLDIALGTLAEWRETGHELRMAVNVSARRLSDLALPGQVAAALVRHRVPPTALALEVTETGILSDPARVDMVISALRLLGVSIAVDDYGTGHASLSYLKRLEVDELKIDKSFVSDMGRDGHDFIIVRSTIALALDLGLRVVAEGIEDEETAAALRQLGCDVGQGYHLGHPTTADAILARLNEERTVRDQHGKASV